MSRRFTITREEKTKLHRDFRKYAAIQELLNNWEQMPKSERLEWSKKVSSVLVRHVEEMIARWEASCNNDLQKDKIKRKIIRKFYFEYGNSLAAIAAE
ncbi:hypothetical protein FACS1894208_09440 [Clostridia bacterium]|nr:hypothetical protein FACS1894208_09440 [Clostridia bacterium]